MIAALVVLVLAGVGITEARRHLRGEAETGSAAAHGARIERYDVRWGFVHRTLAQVGVPVRNVAPTDK